MQIRTITQQLYSSRVTAQLLGIPILVEEFSFPFSYLFRVLYLLSSQKLLVSQIHLSIGHARPWLGALVGLAPV
jgi:hypothetical protein